MQKRSGEFIWVHVVLQVRDSQDSNQQPVIVCTNQVLRWVRNKKQQKTTWISCSPELINGMEQMWYMNANHVHKYIQYRPGRCVRMMMLRKSHIHKL